MHEREFMGIFNQALQLHGVINFLVGKIDGAVQGWKVYIEPAVDGQYFLSEENGIVSNVGVYWFFKFKRTVFGVVHFIFPLGENNPGVSFGFGSIIAVAAG